MLPTVSLDETLSQHDFQETSAQDNGVFQKPSKSASASQNKEMVKLREQIDRLLERLEQQRKDNLQQLEQQRRDFQEQLEQQKEIISLLKASKKL